MPTTKTQVNKVATVIIPVADQDAAIDFYVDQLGFSKRVDVPFEGDKYRWVEVGVGDESTTIAICPPPPHRPETGNRQTEAIALYVSKGFAPIPRYGPFVDDPRSVCFEKRLG